MRWWYFLIFTADATLTGCLLNSIWRQSEGNLKATRRVAPAWFWKATRRVVTTGLSLPPPFPTPHYSKDHDWSTKIRHCQPYQPLKLVDFSKNHGTWEVSWGQGKKDQRVEGDDCRVKLEQNLIRWEHLLQAVVRGIEGGAHQSPELGQRGVFQLQEAARLYAGRALKDSSQSVKRHYPIEESLRTSETIWRFICT